MRFSKASVVTHVDHTVRSHFGFKPSSCLAVLCFGRCVAAMTSGMRGRVAILVFPEKADYLAKIEDLIGTYPTVDCKKHMRRDPAKFIDFNACFADTVCGQNGFEDAVEELIEMVTKSSVVGCTCVRARHRSPVVAKGGQEILQAAGFSTIICELNFIQPALHRMTLMAIEECGLHLLTAAQRTRVLERDTL